MAKYRELSNKEIEEMGKNEPGSAARWLDLRRQELLTEREAATDQQREQTFIQSFTSNGGTVNAGKAAYEKQKNDAAETAASAADAESLAAQRRRISSVL